MSEVEQPRSGDVFIVALLFAVLFGYSLFMAWGNLQGLQAQYEYFGVAESLPWPLLITGLLVPPVLFAAAMAIGRGRQLVARAGILFVALAINAQIALLLEAGHRQWEAAMFGA